MMTDFINNRATDEQSGEEVSVSIPDGESAEFSFLRK